MYLSKKTYVKNWSHQSPEETHSVEVKKGGVIHPSIKPERVSYITESIMDWRKANQIHGWFCNNTHELVDNIRYDVTRENLEQLLSDCKKVLEILNTSTKSVTQVAGGWKDGKEFMVDVEVYDNVDEVMEILPPTQGFFFGSEYIDDYYKQDIENTIEVLTTEGILAEALGCDLEWFHEVKP